MALNIDINEMGGEANVEVRYTPDANPLDETMSLALESASGIELEYATRKQAEGSRFRFYRRIRYLRDRGVKGYDALMIQIEGTTLILSRVPEPLMKVR